MTKLNINIHDAKTNLSKYVQKVRQGARITLCKNGEPVAELVPIEKKSQVRPFGIGKGMGSLDGRFFEPLTEKDFPGAGL